MSTGLSSLKNLPDIAAAYPFHGFEVLFALIMLAFFLIFLVWQISMEAEHHAEIIGNFTASPDPMSYEPPEPLGVYEPELTVKAG